ncbi:alpha/beta hydrolase [Streptomyces sp. WZ.A104]|uniref:alpha/beta fold hydrolase n=1 Tax=Streptomyces sp. WZ.A104 TaxID=2023771 RepID=UPI000BBBF114|nr:alpha/beta fold hydrolase [Streptomyces sp. WZ.A104]PCG86730.1 alpha/beta hydrolase [Streptomyces sp. WZ.A104]
MAVFILVAGAFTGPYVWRDTAARLAADGAEVHTVALTGLGRRPEDPGAVVDLETHVADVLAVIDSVEAKGEAADTEAREGAEPGREIVLVGHDYGIHPVLGAADRRPRSIARIVHLDAGMPQDGVPALAAVPDGRLREELAGAGGRTTGELPPPARDDWSRWGSTAGLSEAALDGLTALAAPQPLGTLLQPMRLTGAVAAVPVTGVLCTGNGPGIEMLQMMVDVGEPALQALAEPRVTFFELPTGHWPMLSCPTRLAEVLTEAAAGGGHRLSSADAAGPPAHLRPFLLDVPERPRERTGNTDLYLPDGPGPHPAVLFVHGGPVPAEARPTPRDWPTLKGYARHVAGLGAVGVTLDHRLHAVTDYERAAADVADAVERVRADPRVDADRVALWFFSGGGPLVADWLTARPAWLRCVAANYPILSPLPGWGLAEPRFHPVRAVAHAGQLPVVLVRAGRESAAIAATVEEFLKEAERCGANVEVIDVPRGRHGFETLDPADDDARKAVHRAVAAVLARLTVTATR